MLHRLREPSELCGSINLLEELLYDRRTWIGEAQELIVVPVLMSATNRQPETLVLDRNIPASILRDDLLCLDSLVG